jgi:transcription termination factor Rho
MPYRPGGRGVGRPNNGQGHDQQPYTPSRGQPVAPYTPYAPHAPYGGNGGYTPEQPQGPDRPQRGGRAPSGNYPQYPEDTRGGRYSDPRHPRDRRHEPASPASYADGGRGQQRGRGPNDRRNMPDNRGMQRGRGVYTNTQGQGQHEGRYGGYPSRPTAPVAPARMVEVHGVLWLGGGHGMSQAELLDERNLQQIARVNPEEARRLELRSGDLIQARASEDRTGRRIVVGIDAVNGTAPDQVHGRPLFEQLTATFPERRVRLEQGEHAPVSTRLIDLFAPLGFGSRALVVAPPKTGKTTLIREAAEAVLTGYPDAVVMAVLVGERPEEVTDLRARLEPRGGIVYAASFDEETERHAWLVQMAVERAKRVAESGRDAFMVLDSLTRLARAENLATRGAGRTLSGGIDAQALDTGRRAFGAARNLDEGGSLTILATCLVDTGSRQDDVVYEEFKGTGNMELHLSRELSQRRLFPAVDVVKSGTRREEMLLTPEELRATTALRRRLADLPPSQATQQLLSLLERTPSNSVLLQALESSGLYTGSARSTSF